MKASKRQHIFVAIATVVFAYVGVRSFTVPISHDEAVTFFLYVQQGAFLPHNMIWDANNHILNSALMYPLYKLFGVQTGMLRLPNVLAFPVYAFFISRLLSGLRSPLMFLSGALALLTAPLLLDFFAQARGYGLSMAGFAGGLYFMSRYFFTRSPKFQWLVWLCFALTVSANMSMMNSYLIALGLVALMMLRMFGVSNLKRHLWPFVIGGILPYGAAAVYAMAMRSRGLLYYGEKDGFVEITVRLLNKYVLYSDSMALAWAIAVLGLVFGGYLLGRWAGRKLYDPDAGTISAVFLLGNAAGAILLRHLLEVNYPEDRTGLYFVPLFLLVLVHAFDMMTIKVPRLKYAAILPAVIPFLAIAKGNIGYTELWRELHVHPEFYEYVAEHHPDGGVTVESYFLTGSSWAFNAFESETKVSPIIAARSAKGRADYAICYRNRCDPYTSTHDTVYRDPHNDTYLMKRREPVQWRPFKEVNDPPGFEGDAKYFNFFVSDDVEILNRIGAMDLKFRVQSDAQPLVCDVVISVRDESDKVIHYEIVSLDWIREQWRGDSASLRRLIHLPEGSHKLVCYIWNLRETEVSISFDEITLLESADE